MVGVQTKFNYAWVRTSLPGLPSFSSPQNTPGRLFELSTVLFQGKFPLTAT